MDGLITFTITLLTLIALDKAYVFLKNRKKRIGINEFVSKEAIKQIGEYQSELRKIEMLYSGIVKDCK